MNTPYTFTTLKYVHDIITGEFAHIGVLIYAPSLEFLEARFLDNFGRLNRFFGSVQSRHLRRIARELQDGTEVLSSRFFESTLFRPDLPADAVECARLLLPADDSSLQFSRLSMGITSDPWATMEQLYERYVGQYAGVSKSEGRRDHEIWRSFRQPLLERVPTIHLEPHLVVAKNFDHRFPFSWRNGVLNVAEPVSFDLRDPQEIKDKANRWLGRGMSLRESTEPFRMALLVGEPSDQSVWPAFENARNILAGIPGEKMIFLERESSRFADFVTKSLAHQDSI